MIFNIVAPNVKIVKNRCFSSWSSLRYVCFPKLEVVEEEGFYNCSVLHTFVGDLLKIIGKSAFVYCFCLTNMNLLNVEEFGENSFFGTSIMKIVNKKGIFKNDCFQCSISLQLIDLESNFTD